MNNFASTFPDEDSYDDVLNYFSSTYIEIAAGRIPQFPTSLWNHYDTALERSPKTTNCCEGFHNALNAIFHCSHPSIWFLFKGLNRDVACNRLTLANAQAGRPEHKRNKYVRLHDAFASIVLEYDRTRDTIKYLRKLSNLQ